MSVIESPGALPLIQRQYDPGLGRNENHNHFDAYQLVLPYSRGRLRLDRDGAVLHDGVVGPGMVRVVAPGERSAITTHARFESVMVKVPRASFEGAWEGDPVAAVHAARREVSGLCPSFVSALGLRGRRRDLVVGGLTRALVGLLLAEPATVEVADGLSDAQWAVATGYAEDRLREGVRLERWAAALHMDVRVFSRRFAKRTGASPYAWFMDLRVTEAMRILVATDLSITDVAELTGFSSQSHFTDAFRRRTGATPGAWRAGTKG